MNEMATNYLDFLQSVYGKAAIEQMKDMSGLELSDIEKASDAFAPTFLKSLLDRPQTPVLSPGSAEGTATTFADIWPAEMVEAMQSFLAESTKAAEALGVTTQPSDKSAFPSSLAAKQQNQMEKLYQVFLGQMAQAQLMDDAAKTTGIPVGQLKKLFPMLTTYGLLPLMPHNSMPSLDDPAAWVDYLGAVGRQTFRQANRDLDSMPSPLHAAFEGLLAGLYPHQNEAKTPTNATSDKAQDVRDATLELQANYIKGLNHLFDHYTTGTSPR